MKKLEISAKHRALIESVIRQNPKFAGNNYLMDVFCETVYKKSYLLIDTIKDSSRLKKHLISICDECIDLIVSNKDKIDVSLDTVNKKPQTIESYKDFSPKKALQKEIVSLKKRTILDEANIEKDHELERVQKGIVNLREEIQKSQSHSVLDALIDPLEFYPPKAVSKNALDKLMFIVKNLSDKYPNKKYYEIFYLRYVKQLNHIEIAREIKISQVELSRRFVEMVKLARESL